MVDLSVAVISGPVGKRPEDITYSFVFDEACRLVQKGVYVHIIRNRFEKDSQSYGIKFHGLDKKIDPKALEFTIKNLKIYPSASLLRKPTTIYWENLYATKVSKVVKDNDIDLMHAHFAYPEGLVGLLAKRNIRKPLVITVHGYDVLSEPSVGYGARLNKKIEYIIRKVLMNADAIIAASNATYNEVLRIVKDASKLYLIPNGVDIEEFNPRINGSIIRKRLGIEDKLVIFTLRHHEPIYGLEYLIKAAPKVLRERRDVVFVIGGDGSLKAFHKILARRLGIGEEMIFTGRIPRNEIPYYYAMSDIVVVPSLQEAFGLVISEAMACGKPVIGTSVGGIPDQIIDGYNGFLVRPKDPVSIAERILWLLENPKEAGRMGLNGRRMVEEKFNINKRIEKIVNLYEKLV